MSDPCSPQQKINSQQQHQPPRSKNDKITRQKGLEVLALREKKDWQQEVEDYCVPINLC